MNDRTITRTFWSVVFGIILVLGGYATFVRFTQGLGASTNLSDAFPWGLWIGFDLLVGVGLAAGGFVIAATVHLFKLEKWEPIARPAILTAFLGYLLVIVALLFDIGRPYRIWHPMVMGNPHSVMFEVAICVMLYTTVLALEFSPLLFARLGWKKPLHLIHTLYIPIVILGVLLSTLHQSSLGTLYVIVPTKMHPLWYTPLLPAFFFLSAIAGGLAMTIFESFMSARAFGRRLEPELLEGLGRIMVVVLAVLLVWKMQNLYDRGSLSFVFEPSTESVMFWGEMLLGVALPMVLLMFERVRQSNGGLFFAAMLTIMGFVLGRLNVAITSLTASSGVNYIPSWMEFAVTALIVAAGFYFFRLAVIHLEVFPREKSDPFTAPEPPPRTIFAGRALIGLWAFLIAGFIMVAFTGKRGSHAEELGVEPRHEAGTLVLSSDLNTPGDLQLPQSPDSPGPVTFDHSTHTDIDNPGCVDCHSGVFSIVPEQRPGPGVVDYHGKAYCGRCHNDEDAFDIDGDCEDCHAD